MKLFRCAQWQEVSPGSIIAQQGKVVDGVYLLYNGEVSVVRDGTEIGRPRDGALIGEMSFVQGGKNTCIRYGHGYQALPVCFLAKNRIKVIAPAKSRNRCRS